MKDNAHHLKQVQRKVIQKERQAAPPPVEKSPKVVKPEKVHVEHPRQNIYRIRVDVH